MINEIFAVSKKVKPRTANTVLIHLMEEVGELSTEVLIANNKSDKVSGPDGVIGEAVDVVLCAIDLIYVEYPLVSQEEIMEVFKDKLKKWKTKNS